MLKQSPGGRPGSLAVSVAAAMRTSIERLIAHPTIRRDRH